MELPGRTVGARLLLFVACTGFFVFMLGRVSAADGGEPANWSLDQWKAWRDGQIKAILTPTFDANGSKILSRQDVILRCVEAYKVLGPMLSRSGFLDANSGRSRELGNFAKFVVAQARLDYHNGQGVYNHALGYEISDQDYFSRSSSELKIPDLLTSQEFLTDMSDPLTYKNAVSLIAEHNTKLAKNQKWIVFLYRSQFLKSVDKATYGRMLVLVPDEKAPDGGYTDRWIQYAIATPGDAVPKETKSVSMVVVHRDRFGVSTSKAYLCDFMRQRDSTNRFSGVIPTMLLRDNASKNCYECHKSPVLPIHPKKAFEFNSSAELVESRDAMRSMPDLLNARISNYAMCEFMSMNSDSYGPTIGPNEITLSDEFIRDSANDPSLSAESLAKLRIAMKCESCHSSPSKINYPQAVQSSIGFQNFEQKVGIVQTYIESGWMPPNNNLTAAERRALWKTLYNEYLNTSEPTGPSGQFVTWLKGG